LQAHGHTNTQSTWSPCKLQPTKQRSRH
jgi:hypothetical protein